MELNLLISVPCFFRHNFKHLFTSCFVINYIPLQWHNVPASCRTCKKRGRFHNVPASIRRFFNYLHYSTFFKKKTVRFLFFSSFSFSSILIGTGISDLKLPSCALRPFHRRVRRRQPALHSGTFRQNHRPGLYERTDKRCRRQNHHQRQILSAKK